MRQQKRPVRAFFCLTLLTFHIGTGNAATPCDTTYTDLAVTVAKVIDGDTVVITTGEHIRLIGIDTPEMNYETGQPEPGAIEAREYLQELLRDKAKQALVFDAERYDRYGRGLAHLFLVDGTNVQAAILSSGHAVTLSFPPGLKFLQCYHQAAEAARRDNLGMWQYPEYQPVLAEQLPVLTPGYRIITGTVESITESKYTLTLNMYPDINLKILKEDLKYFANMDIKGLVNALIRVQGELYTQHGQLAMRIRHPIDINIVSVENKQTNQSR